MSDTSFWTYLIVLGPFIGGGLATAVISRLHENEDERASEKKLQKAKSASAEVVDAHLKRELARKADGVTPQKLQHADDYAHQDVAVQDFPQDLNLAEFTGRDATSPA